MATIRARAKSTPARSGKPPTRTLSWSLLLPEIMLYLVVIATPLVLDKFSSNIMDIKDVVLGLGVFLALSLWFLAGLAEGHLSWIPSRLTTAVLAYLIWSAITICYSSFWIVSVSDFGRLAANVGLYLVVLMCVRTLTQVRHIVYAISIVSICMCLYGLAQYAGFEPLNVEWQRTQGRIFSFAGNPTYLAGFLILVTPLLFTLGWPVRTEGEETSAYRRRVGQELLLNALAVLVGAIAFKLWPRVLCDGALLGYGAFALTALVKPDLRRAVCFSAAIFGTIILAISFTFAAIGGLFIGTVFAVGIILVQSKGKTLRTTLLVTTACIICLILLAKPAYQHLDQRQRARVDKILQWQDPSAIERQLQARVAYTIFRQHPIFGQGYSAYRVTALELMSADWYRQRGKRFEGMLAPNHAHQEYLQTLADTGLIGGLLFLAMLLLALHLAFRVSLRHPEVAWRRIGIGITVAVIAFLFQNLFGVTFRITGSNTFFWFCLGVLVVAEAQRTSTANAPATPVLRTRTFRPWGFALLAPVTVAAILLGCLAYYTIRPVIGNRVIRYAQESARRGKYEAAIFYGKETLKYLPYSANAYYTLAFAYGNLQQYEEAAKANEAAIRLAPGNASTYFNLGISYKLAGKWDKAIENLHKAAELMPVPYQYFGLAEAYYYQGDYAKAEQYDRQAIARHLALQLRDNDKLGNYYKLLAMIAAERHDSETELHYAKAAARYRPKDESILTQQIHALYALRRYGDIERQCRQWTEADPNSSSAWRFLADVRYRLKNYAGARDSLLQALRLNSNDIRVRLNLAYCYAKLNDLLNYRAQLETIIRIDGDDPMVAEAREKLSKLPQ